MGTAGTTVSSVKLMLVGLLLVPAAFLATTATLMLPSCNWLAPLPTLAADARSAALKVTACGEPVPVTVWVTVFAGLALSVKVTVSVLPLSALTSTTPVASRASACVAPSGTPAPRVSTGVPGTVVSMLKLASLASVVVTAGLPVAGLPAMSVMPVVKSPPTTEMVPISLVLLLGMV